MTSFHRTIAAAAAGLALLALGTTTTAQQPQSAPYRLVMGEDEARDMLQALSTRARYVPGELLVKFRDGVATSAQNRALSAVRGGISGQRTRWIGDVVLVGTPGEPDAELAARMLERQPEVEWAQPNYLAYRRVTPNDPQYSVQWNFDLVDLPRAWDINPGASNAVTIAVIDSGITATTTTFPFNLWTGSRFETVSIPFRANPDIAAARIETGRDFVFWTGPVLDMDWHGSHVAGTALQETNNGVAVAGIAYTAKLLPLKVCLSYWDIQIIQGLLNIPGFVDPGDVGCPVSAMAQAIRHAADNGAQVINMSLGATTEAPVLQQALLYAVQRGAFVALPAGNGFEEGNEPEYPAAYAREIDGVVAVGAVGRSSRRAFYSNTGSYVELAAPGGDPFDGGESGLVFQFAPAFTDFDPARVVRPSFDRYALIGSAGTSQAAPHAAGLAALLYSQGITQPAAIEAVMKRFATDLGPSGRDDEYGHGLINARAALRGMGLAK
jgi:serine protease